jgi:FKBP-type peptidyl-prolyl cis-trans isomerase 2
MINQRGKPKVEMKRIDSDSIVDMIFHLKWKSEFATHTDGYQASRINIWRDFFPPDLLAEIKDRQAGDRMEVDHKAGEILPPFDERNLIQVKRDQLDRRLGLDAIAKPEVGRFYPKGMLKNVTGVYSANTQPCRCVELSNGHMTVDLNHPLSGKDLVISAVVGKVETKFSSVSDDITTLTELLLISMYRDPFFVLRVGHQI